MKVYSFHSKKNHQVYGFTPDATGGNLPPAFAPWAKFHELDVNPGDPPRVAVKSEDILEGIRRDGFYLAGVQIKITEKIVRHPPKKKK